MTTPQALRLNQRADALQSALPSMLVEADRVAATLLQGIHGRKRAGTGETFWQYRPYGFGDSTQRIDWRKSARSSQIFIRENEWEAANTLWLWANPAASMHFNSHLASVTKRDRANLLTLALASLALRAHERVALLGSGGRPAQARSALLPMAQHLILSKGESLPSRATLIRNSAVVMFSDFLEPLEETAAALTRLAQTGVRGHLVQINDPAEETLPYDGRVEFRGLGTPLKFVANKTEELRQAYAEKFQSHRAGLKALAGRLGWSFTTHYTDKAPGPLLMQLYARLSDRP